MTDEELMDAYARGDAIAFERLFERMRRPLFTYLLHLSGDREVAEDLFQEVFLRLIRTRRKYTPSGNFQAWLFTIARNVMIDHRRRFEVRNMVRSEGEMPDQARPIPSEDPVFVAQIRAVRERIQEALHQLPEAQREVFLLREKAGLDFKHIARVTGCRVATAKSRMRYALANLRRHLSEDLASTLECYHE